MDVFWSKRRALIITMICLIYASSMYRLSFAEEKTYVNLRAGTPILCEIVDSISSKHYSMGHTFPVVVSRAVKVDDHVVILPNTEVYAKVSKLEKASGWGGEGQIGIILESCMAVDEQEILISASQMSEGSSSHGAATAVGVGAGLVCLPFALAGFAVKGEEGKIPAGTTIKARVDGDYRVAVLDKEDLQQKQFDATLRLKELRKRAEEKAKQEEAAEEKKKPNEGTLTLTDPMNTIGRD